MMFTLLASILAIPITEISIFTPRNNDYTLSQITNFIHNIWPSVSKLIGNNLVKKEFEDNTNKIMELFSIKMHYELNSPIPRSMAYDFDVKLENVRELRWLYDNIYLFISTQSFSFEEMRIFNEYDPDSEIVRTIIDNLVSIIVNDQFEVNLGIEKRFRGIQKREINILDNTVKANAELNLSRAVDDIPMSTMKALSDLSSGISTNTIPTVNFTSAPPKLMNSTLLNTNDIDLDKLSNPIYVLAIGVFIGAVIFGIFGIIIRIIKLRKSNQSKVTNVDVNKPLV